jgi:general secretion pathway protein E
MNDDMSGIMRSKLPIPETFASEYLEYYRMLPLEIADDRVRVAVAGEPNAEAVADLRSSYGLPVDLVQVEEPDLRAAIGRAFAAAESVVELVRDLSLESGSFGGETLENTTTDVRDLANQPPVIRFVNLLVREAHDSSASDIHLEAMPEGLRIRLRIDGVLSELPSPPRMLQAAVVSRVKLLAELDIAERRQPQDGRIRVRLEARELDLRVSTVPTLHGESVVLRLLDRGGRSVGLEDLGMSPELLTAFERLARKPHGILLATGPTGSGKTTTLYAALGLRHPSEEKIITVEDPVEYHLSGVTQVPVHQKAGMTFATALRSILRQDPDVLMVGEMRDGETAAIAVQAAMTGHLVFSTLHTNDAASALTRLADLKVEPCMVAGTLEGVLAQRLVRRICQDCRERYRPDPAVVALLARRQLRGLELERGRGCDACRQTGYRGRTGIFELLVITEDLKRQLVSGIDLVTIREGLRAEGVATLRDDAWAKVQAGITTVEEVLRVVE